MLTLAKMFDFKLDVKQYKWTDKKQAKAISERFHDWQITVLFPFFNRGVNICIRRSFNLSCQHWSIAENGDCRKGS